MINPQVPLHRLVLSMADAMDCVHREISNHQLRVAYMATSIARQMGRCGQELLDVLVAAALHDIALVRSDYRVAAVHHGKLEQLAWHGEAGYLLLRDQPLLASAACLIRAHHVRWENGRGAVHQGRPVPLGSHMIHLADEVDRAIDRTAPILRQRDRILRHLSDKGARWFHPECLAAFAAAAAAEGFWLDCMSDRLYGILLRQSDSPTLMLDEQVIGPLAELFGHLVDAGSRWTATHSAGVTATATALARRMGFSPREQGLMRAAGYLHDLGKLTIPAEILDKPEGLDADEALTMRQHAYHTFAILDTIGGLPQICEWAAFHHERLDGQGYPFRLAGRNLTLGSRVMAVADVFTAVAEDRPYRAALGRAKALAILDNQATQGALDGDVVAALRADAEAIDALRLTEQAEYARRQAPLVECLNLPEARSAG